MANEKRSFLSYTLTNGHNHLTFYVCFFGRRSPAIITWNQSECQLATFALAIISRALFFVVLRVFRLPCSSFVDLFIHFMSFDLIQHPMSANPSWTITKTIRANYHLIRPENRLEDRIKRKQPNTNKRKHTATATAVKNKLLNSRLFCFSLVFSALLLILSCLLSIRKKRRSSHVVVYCYHTQVNGLRYYELYQTLIVFLICFVPAVFFHHSHTHDTRSTRYSRYRCRSARFRECACIHRTR